MNRYELTDNFMMTRLSKPPATSGRPYELIENVSDGNYIFSNIPYYSYQPLCVVFMTEREIQYKKNIKKQVNYLNIQKRMQILCFA